MTSSKARTTSSSRLASMGSSRPSPSGCRPAGTVTNAPSPSMCLSAASPSPGRSNTTATSTRRRVIPDRSVTGSTTHGTPQIEYGRGGRLHSQFIEPAGSEHLGRARSGARAGPVRVSVGSRLTLSIAVARPHIWEYMGEPEAFNVCLVQVRGPPGEVILSESTIRPEGGDTVERKLATTRATFPVPGEYVVLAQAFTGSVPSRCCWSNGYVQVSVVE